MFYDQSEFDVRCEWGLRGVEALTDEAAVMIIVDVLSFSTCVSIATSNGAEILPFQHDFALAEKFALDSNAHLASRTREVANYSLSPSSLLSISSGERLVLPSPNGSAFSLATGSCITLAGCLRNATATSAYAASFDGSIAVIPCGERWPDGSLRPAIEDLIGAGAIIHKLSGRKSPEAQIAESAYLTMRQKIVDTIMHCSSGRELIERGCRDDVLLACELDASNLISLLRSDTYVRNEVVAG